MWLRDTQHVGNLCSQGHRGLESSPIITSAPCTHTLTFRGNLDSRFKNALHVFGAQEESGEKTDTGRISHFQTSPVLFG